MQSLRSYFIGVVVVLLGLGVGSQVAGAHQIGWGWDYGQGQGVVLLENRTTNFVAEVIGMRVDYNNTDLTVTQCADNGQCGRVVALEGNWGNTGWFSFAHVFKDLNECAAFPYGNVTGNCDWWFRKANWAYIYMNNYYGVQSSAMAQFLLRHEFGHVVGLAHSGCGIWSVMRTNDCGSGPAQLQSHDIGDINSYY
jgi:hypothetical protein